MNYVLTTFLLLFFLAGGAQGFDLEQVVGLSEDLRESSGLLYRDGVFITHNDSGDSPFLYELDTLTGDPSRSTYVTNAQAIDWEELAADDDYLYIGDFGNNLGARTDLRIYRVAWEDYWQSTDDAVTAEIIDFRYAEQTNFEEVDNTVFDAESLIAGPDSLYLFTKNRQAPQTKVYALPKTPGNYVVAAIDSFAVPGLLTGVDYEPTTHKLLFVGYTFGGAFVYELTNFSFQNFAEADVRSWNLPLEGSFQTEAIAFTDDRFAYLSTEGNQLGEPAFYRLDTDFISNLRAWAPTVDLTVFPNPTTDRKITFSLKDSAGELPADAIQLLLRNSLGQVVWQTDFRPINGQLVQLPEYLSAGVYAYELRNVSLLATGIVVIVE